MKWTSVCRESVSPEREREMGRSPVSVSRGGAAVVNKGPWTEAEDHVLAAYITAHGEGNWRLIPKLAGLSRCGKSCRLRWINYLRPDLKRGNFSPDEDNLILTLHALLGNRWSLIAGRIPGRTDNEIKNYWNTHLKRRLKGMGIDPMSYRVGLTLVPNEMRDEEEFGEEEEDSLVEIECPKVSAADHTGLTVDGSSGEKVDVTSSSETCSSLCSYGSLDSSSMSAELEGVLPYWAPPPGMSTSDSSEEEQFCARSDVGYSQHQLVNAESFLENFHAACGWEYDHRLDSHLQLLDQMNLEPLDCFDSGMLSLQNDVQAPWTPLCLFDSLF